MNDMSTRPTCDDCDRPAERVIRDWARGIGLKGHDSHRHICAHHYAALVAQVDPDDPWKLEYPTLRTYDKEPPVSTETPSLSEQLAPLAAEYADLAEKADRIKERQEEIKAAIRDLVPGPDAYDAGGLSVVVATSRRFNEKKALPLVPENILPLISYPETRIDKDKLKALLPDVFEAAQDVYADRITVK